MAINWKHGSTLQKLNFGANLDFENVIVLNKKSFIIKGQCSVNIQEFVAR